MASEWPTLTVDQIKARNDRAIAIGPFGSRMKADVYVSQGVPVIRGNNISDTRALRGEFVFVNAETADDLRGCNVFAGDLVFPHRGAIGQVGIVPADGIERYMLSTSLMKLTCCRDLVDPLFLFYFFRSPVGRHALLQHASTVGTPGIGQPLASLRSIKVPVPPLSEQRAIAHILGTLDSKIEMNGRMSETLDAMARALFKSWFVDFDPVRAKADGRDPKLPKPLVDLFPNRLIASELGEIPKGWKVAPLGIFFDAVKGVSYKGDGLADSGMPLHNLNSVYESGGYKYEGIKYYTGEYRDRHLVRPGDVIVANTEQGHDRLLIGYAALVPGSFGDRGIASHHIYRLRSKPGSGLTEAFLCYLLNSSKMHDIVSGYANGTTVNMLPIDGVQQPLVACPPSPLVSVFTTLALHVERRREEMISESRALAALRDALLPKLLSGELRVRAAKRFLGGAVA
jgi:type I restriction enzyme S subunit